MRLFPLTPRVASLGLTLVLSSCDGSPNQPVRLEFTYSWGNDTRKPPRLDFPLGLAIEVVAPWQGVVYTQSDTGGELGPLGYDPRGGLPWKSVHGGCRQSTRASISPGGLVAARLDA